MTLRPYQQRAHDKVIVWVKSSTLPCLVEAVTSAGKSHILGALAKTVHDISGGKRILCLAPSAELIDQNTAKYRATGNKCSVFSASAGERSLRHPVIMGTPLTVLNSISRFGSDIAMVVLDEADLLTPTVKAIIEVLKEKNPNLRVVGLTATPYRMGTGYIFAQWPDGRPVSQHQTIDPYFEKLVDRITAKELLELEFLTPVRIGQIGSEHYETLHMQLNRMDQFDAAEVDRVFVGQGRKTAAVLADVVRQSQGAKGVMIFAATVQHAQECMESLPPTMSRMIGGAINTKKDERKRLISDFKAGKFKYFVSVGILTTGFDAPHVDVIAILRATESRRLLQQIIGRGMRIDDGKTELLLLDYAENIERHCDDGDLFNPEISVRVKADKGAALVKCRCPSCGGENEFGARQNDAGYECDEEGYFTDLDGNRIPTEFGDTPAHYGRRCQHRWVSGTTVQRCGYRWTFKECPSCLADNDIAARYCVACKGEIVDPNEKLHIAFKQLKRDPTKLQTDVVHEWTVRPTVSSRGKEMDRVDVVTAYRSFSFWLAKVPTTNLQLADRDAFDRLGGALPETITYRKDPDSGFFRVLGYNRPADVEQTTQRRAVQLDLVMMGGAA